MAAIKEVVLTSNAVEQKQVFISSYQVYVGHNVQLEHSLKSLNTRLLDAGRHTFRFIPTKLLLAELFNLAAIAMFRKAEDSQFSRVVMHGSR